MRTQAHFGLQWAINEGRERPPGHFLRTILSRHGRFLESGRSLRAQKAGYPVGNVSRRSGRPRRASNSVSKGLCARRESVLYASGASTSPPLPPGTSRGDEFARFLNSNHRPSSSTWKLVPLPAIAPTRRPGCTANCQCSVPVSSGGLDELCTQDISLCLC